MCQVEPDSSLGQSEEFFQDVFPISLRLFRNVYAALWEILRTQQICILLLSPELTSLVSGTIAVNDNKIQNIFVYSSVNR